MPIIKQEVELSGEVMIEFEVYCHCGKGLCGQTFVKGVKVTIEPCKDCLEDAYNRGYDKGYDDGVITGYDDGYKKG